jgi:hypothetical protein
MGSVDSDSYTTVMTAERLLVGAFALIAPGPLLTTFGVAPEFNTAAVRYATRLFGVRNAALGVQLWLARGDRREVVRLAGLNAAVELVDLVDGLTVAAQSRELRRSGVAVSIVSVAAAAGFLGLRASAGRA